MLNIPEWIWPQVWERDALEPVILEVFRPEPDWLGEYLKFISMPHWQAKVYEFYTAATTEATAAFDRIVSSTFTHTSPVYLTPLEKKQKAKREQDAFKNKLKFKRDRKLSFR